MKNFLIVSASLLLVGCGQTSHDEPEAATSQSTPSGSHTHADGTMHADHGDPEHEEVDLGLVTIGDMEIDVSQSHGVVQPGKESHLIVRLPYSDNGATVVRAWLGGADRTLAYVGKGAYDRSRDAYDVHAPAPDPLPEDIQWWIEIERPAGEKAVGSIEPRLE